MLKPKFIKLTITPKGCQRYFNIAHIVNFINENKPENTLVLIPGGIHFVKETAEEIMTLIEDA